MPNYVTEAELTDSHWASEQDLIDLTDYDGDGAVDTDVVDDALVSAEGEVDGYLAKQYDIPLTESPIPDMVKDIVKILAIHRLRSRAGVGYNEAWMEEVKNARRLLAAIARGDVEIPITTDDAGRATVVGSETRSFSRDNFSGW